MRALTPPICSVIKTHPPCLIFQSFYSYFIEVGRDQSIVHHVSKVNINIHGEFSGTLVIPSRAGSPLLQFVDEGEDEKEQSDPTVNHESNSVHERDDRPLSPGLNSPSDVSTIWISSESNSSACINSQDGSSSVNLSQKMSGVARNPASVVSTVWISSGSDITTAWFSSQSITSPIWISSGSEISTAWFSCQSEPRIPLLASSDSLCEVSNKGKKRAAQLHPLLAYDRLLLSYGPGPISYDVTYPPIGKVFFGRTHLAVHTTLLVQPATDPPTAEPLVLRSPKFPWSIIVNPGLVELPEKYSKTNGVVTNLDILHEVHRKLSLQLTHEEWEQMGTGSLLQRKVAQSYENRCTNRGGVWENGVRRVDLLGRNTKLIGMKLDEDKQNHGELIFVRL